MGLNMKQEESWKKSGIVCPKGQSSCTILESVRNTLKDDCRLHVTRDRTTATRYVHGLGNSTPRVVIMIDLRAVRNTAGTVVTDISTFSGRDRFLGADKLAASWSQRDFELILNVKRLEWNVHILQYLDMQILHIPHRRLKADEVLTLADAEGLQMHNDLVVTAFDVRTGRNQLTNITTARPLCRTFVLSTDASRIQGRDRGIIDHQKVSSPPVHEQLRHCKQLLQEVNTGMLNDMTKDPQGINLRWVFNPPQGPATGKWHLYQVKSYKTGSLDVTLYPVKLKTPNTLEDTEVTVDHVDTLKSTVQTTYIHNLCRTSVYGNVTNLQNCISEPACIVSQTTNYVLLLDGNRVHISTPPSHLLNLEYFVRQTLTAHARQRSHMPHYKQKCSDSDLKTAGGHPATCFSQEVTEILLQKPIQEMTPQVPAPITRRFVLSGPHTICSMRAVVTGKQAFDTATVLVHLKKDGWLGLLGIESNRAPSIVVDNKNGVQHNSLNDTVLEDGKYQQEIADLRDGNTTSWEGVPSNENHDRVGCVCGQTLIQFLPVTSTYIAV